jgi:hypothetical protein
LTETCARVDPAIKRMIPKASNLNFFIFLLFVIK